MDTQNFEYQDAIAQTRPPGDFESFKIIHGRDPTTYEAEHNLGLAGLGRFTGKPATEPVFAKYEKIPVLPAGYRESKYVDSGFQTAKPAAIQLAIARAKAKASLLVSKYGRFALECGIKVWSEIVNDRVVHTEQFAVKILLDADGNAQEGQVIEGRFLPNIYGEDIETPASNLETIVDTSEPLEPITVYAPSEPDDAVDEDDDTDEDYRMSQAYDVLQFIAYDPIKAQSTKLKRCIAELALKKAQKRKASDSPTEETCPHIKRIKATPRKVEGEKPTVYPALSAATQPLSTVKASTPSKKRVGDLNEKPSLTVIFPKNSKLTKRDLSKPVKVDTPVNPDIGAKKPKLDAPTRQQALSMSKETECVVKSSGDSNGSAKDDKVDATAKEGTRAASTPILVRDTPLKQERATLVSKKRPRELEATALPVTSDVEVTSSVKSAVEPPSEPRNKRAKIEPSIIKRKTRLDDTIKAARSQLLSSIALAKVTKSEGAATKVESAVARKAEDHQCKTTTQMAPINATPQPRPGSAALDRIKARAAKREADKAAMEAEKKAATSGSRFGARGEIQRYVPRALRQKN